MKLCKNLLLAAAAAFLAVSCNTANQPVKTEHKALADSSQYARVSMDIELPVAKPGAAEAIRSTLLSVLYRQMSCLSFESDESSFVSFTSSPTRTRYLLFLSSVI